MEYRIIADSGCDMTKELKKKLGVETVPILMTLAGETFVDDDSLDMDSFMERMRTNTGSMETSCPSPGAFSEKLASGVFTFIVTLSGKISGSNGSAIMGKLLAEEKENVSAHVFDSKSASAGETLVVLKLRQLIDKGMQGIEIIEAVDKFIDGMKTYLVLDNLDNLIKSGRINKILGKAISALNIKAMLGSDGEGNIAFFSHARGEKQIVEKLASTIEKSGKSTKGENAIISHCDNLPLAQRLAAVIKSRYSFENILITPTGGMSSLFANRKGIIMAF